MVSLYGKSEVTFVYTGTYKVKASAIVLEIMEDNILKLSE